MNSTSSRISFKTIIGILEGWLIIISKLRIISDFYVSFNYDHIIANAGLKSYLTTISKQVNSLHAIKTLEGESIIKSTFNLLNQSTQSSCLELFDTSNIYIIISKFILLKLFFGNEYLFSFS